MKKYIINKIMNIIKKYTKYTEEKYNEIKYGLEALYLTIFKSILYLILSIIFKYTKELILFTITYGLLRRFAFGLHAKKAIQCWIFSSIVFIVFPLIIKYIQIDKIILIILSIPFLFIIFKYSPADTEKRPIIKKRKYFKIMSSLISIIYLIIIINTNKLFIINLLFLSLLLESILILPISYKVLGLKYSNYLIYIEKEAKI